MSIIKLDIDSRKINWKRISTVIQLFGLHVDFDKSKICKTNKGHHIYLAVKETISDEQLCFIQLAMDSDYKREMLNWKRIVAGSEWQRRNWNVLFSAKFHVDTKGNKRIASKETELDKKILRKNIHEL